ncbi:MAG: amino acid carrier protein [Gammaproteobacteria bacterium]|nr:amino acid carrier protein [Gammaproteobacteria bacterium]MDH5501481.1 amino acid carrier protein [Gammaproteobacteria bacterium]
MDLSNLLASINGVLWNETWLYIIAGTGLLFTFWSGFCQFRALTHGPTVVRGVYDDPNDPGAINHFQALSAALSGTVGLGNIGGVALAIVLGGPGAIFWMWVVGFLGMSIKLTEVTLSMLYRNTDDPDNPHGGPMWVADKALARMRPELAWLGKILAVLFSLCVALSAITGGNMFQAWNVADITREYFGVAGWITGAVLAALVGVVILGGIKRIGRVAGTLVPGMVFLYIIAGFYVLFVHFDQIPAMLMLIVKSAFTPTDAAGAFIGGTVGSAFLFGMKRAIFSNEAGQGSSAIAHSAAKTDEPVREGLVAGLEPFIDTIVVCTFTAVIILATGIWNRAPDVSFEQPPQPELIGREWQYADTALTTGEWRDGETVLMIVKAGENPATGRKFHRLSGAVLADRGSYRVEWQGFRSDIEPQLTGNGFYRDHVGATLTAKAFDTVMPGLGKWLITVASWLFAISTIIAWGYYGEQGVVYIAGNKGVLPYRLVYVALTFVATLGHIKSSTDLDNLTGIGLGVIIYANLPILWIFGYQAMRAYKDYITRLKDGRMGPDHPPPSIDDLLSGRDVAGPR